MRPPLAVTVWRISLTWGLLSLLAGVIATAFIATAGSVLTFSAWLSLVFALPIFTVYAARRSPILAGVGLLVAFALVLAGAVTQGELASVPVILRRDYVWLHVVFGTAFVIFSRGIRQAFPAPTNYADVPPWKGSAKVQSWMAYRPPKMRR